MRFFRICLSLAVLVAPLKARCNSAQEEKITLSTRLGTFFGLKVNGARLFPNIQYVEVPTGKLRWRRVALLTTARQRENPVACPQYGNDNFGGEKLPQQEDCLYMNVWAPPEGTNHPVILFIHGGGLISGNGLQRFYDGSVFTNHGVVFVAFNYRLAELGYGPNLEKELGSLGLKDQERALEWVTRNIDLFGGDPNKIYLMGHSKGAEAVMALLETGAAGKNVRGGIAMSNGRHFDMSNNHSFSNNQTEFLPGEKDAPWPALMKLKQDIGVYVPVISHARLPGEASHRFSVFTSVLYDERFWSGTNEMYCTQAFEMKAFFDYSDAYFHVLHPGLYEHGDEIYSLFKQTKFGKELRDRLVYFVNHGKPPRLTFGISPKPFRGSFQVTHVYPWFSLPGTFRDEWNGVNCIHPENYPGSQINGFWFGIESILNTFNYGRKDRKYVLH